MPEPRTSRDLQAVPPVQVDTARKFSPAESRARYRAGLTGGRTVEIRNGLPEPSYRYQGAGHDTTECDCHA
jgi:hypothetical protein